MNLRQVKRIVFYRGLNRNTFLKFLLKRDGGFHLHIHLKTDSKEISFCGFCLDYSGSNLIFGTTNIVGQFHFIYIVFHLKRRHSLFHIFIFLSSSFIRFCTESRRWRLLDRRENKILRMINIWIQLTRTFLHLFTFICLDLYTANARYVKSWIELNWTGLNLAKTR